MSRLCKKHATKRKIEHMPNIIVIGNASTFKDKPKEPVSLRPIKSQIPAIYLSIYGNATYIVQHNAHKNIERNAEEVHDGAPGFLRNVLGPHFHNGRPEYPHTSLKNAEPKKLNTTCK
jgi:hypothetical protein